MCILGYLKHILYTNENDLVILGYGCVSACARICNESQMKPAALFVGTKNTHKT